MHAPSTSRAQFGWYLRNALHSEACDDIFDLLLRSHYRIAGIPKPPRSDPASGDDEAATPVPGTSAHAKLFAEVAGRLEHFRMSLAERSAFEQNVDHAVFSFGLTALDAEILRLGLRSRWDHELRSLGNSMFERLESIPRTVAALLGALPDDVEARLSPAAPLRACGLVVVDDMPGHLFSRHDGLQVPEAMRRHMRLRCNAAEWAEAIIGRECRTTLDWSDFSHLGEVAEVAARALKAASAIREPGMHIMLYGPPGTGKTEFAAALARQADLRLFAVGEVDEDGDEPSRSDRLAALRASHSILRHLGGAVVLLDEAEDVLEARRSYGSNREQISKAYLNRTLEAAGAPTIWTCNSIGWMDPATLRRMTLLIEMKVPDAPARRRIWSRVLQHEAVAVDANVVDRLARRWTAPAAAAASAARAARLAGGGGSTVETALSGIMAVLSRDIPPEIELDKQGAEFDPALTACSEDLEALCTKLARPRASRDWSLCLSGPPGTGKSEFARYLAARLNLPVLQKRASDLLSMWVGGSEQAIASAFAEARTQGALLLIEEVEALLFDRSAAERSFEVSQVDEMLTWIERHPLPLICTTNLPERMDRAVPRRFTLKLRFETLDQVRATLAFRRLLKAEPPELLPEGLTPGDFAVVRRKAALLDVQDPGRWVQWLKEEAAAKGGVRVPIGFRTAMPERRTKARET